MFSFSPSPSTNQQMSVYFTYHFFLILEYHEELLEIWFFLCDHLEWVKKFQIWKKGKSGTWNDIEMKFYSNIPRRLQHQINVAKKKEWKESWVGVELDEKEKKTKKKIISCKFSFASWFEYFEWKNRQWDWNEDICWQMMLLQFVLFFVVVAVVCGLFLRGFLLFVVSLSLINDHSFESFGEWFQWKLTKNVLAWKLIRNLLKFNETLLKLRLHFPNLSMFFHFFRSCRNFNLTFFYCRIVAYIVSHSLHKKINVRKILY